MSGKQLIVNADDLGISRGVTDAIFACHRHGIVTSASLIANVDGARYAASLLPQFPELGVGVHLNVTHGRPLCEPAEVSDLVDDRGCFLRPSLLTPRLWSAGRIRHQITREFARQVQRAIELGVTPTHVDSHHGIHKRPAALLALVAVARWFAIRCARSQYGPVLLTGRPGLCGRSRVLIANLRRSPTACYERATRALMRASGLATADTKVSTERMLPRAQGQPKEGLQLLLRALPHGINELIVHPGEFGTRGLESQFEDVRRRDTLLTRHEDIAQTIVEEGIELVSYRALRGSRRVPWRT